MVAIVFLCEVTTSQTAFAPTFDLHVNCLFLIFVRRSMCMSTASAQLLDKFLISVVERWLLTSLVVVRLVTPTGGGETGSPLPKSGSFISDGRGYFGGRGTAHRPLPHILEVVLLLVSGDFGGRRIGTFPFLLTLPVGTSEEEGQALLLTTSASTSEEEGQAFLLTPSVCTSCVWSR